MDTLSFEFLNTLPMINIVALPDVFVELSFTDAPENFFVGQNNNATILQISEESNATIFTDTSCVSIYFDRIDLSVNMPHSFTIHFDNAANINITGKHSAILTANDIPIHIDATDCIISNIGNNNVLITMLGINAMMRLGLSPFSALDSTSTVSLQSVSIQSVTDGRLVVPASKRIPEFVISLYDDPDYQLIRPSRFGVPVVSTVPGFVPDSSWNITVPQAEKDLMELGVGTESRIMYFKVISDQTIDVSMRDSLRLYIDLPFGTDTVERQVSIPLEYLDSENTNDIFIGQYVFHREDTVNYVDGFAYLSVKLPLRIQRNLPLLFQVSSDGNVFNAEHEYSARDAVPARGIVEPFSAHKTKAVLLKSSEVLEPGFGKKTKQKRTKNTKSE